MTTRICTRGAVAKRKTDCGLRVSCVLLVAAATASADAKLEASQQFPMSQFGWQSGPAMTVSPMFPMAISSNASTASADESTARVITVMEAAGFNTVYLELESGARRFWIAAGTTAVRAGNIVHFPRDQATAMDNFESKALKRTFDRIYFVPAVTVAEIDP